MGSIESVVTGQSVTKENIMLTEEQTQLKIYIAGPMRGYPGLNRKEFNKAARLLEQKKFYEIFNPAEWDEALGLDIENLYERDELAKAMQRDLNAICNCDCIYMLTGWERSEGARIEHALATQLGLMIIYQ